MPDKNQKKSNNNSNKGKKTKKSDDENKDRIDSLLDAGSGFTK